MGCATTGCPARVVTTARLGAKVSGHPVSDGFFGPDPAGLAGITPGADPEARLTAGVVTSVGGVVFPESSLIVPGVLWDPDS